MEAQIDGIFIKNINRIAVAYNYDAITNNLKWIVRHPEYFSSMPSASQIELAQKLLVALESSTLNAYGIMRSREYIRAVELVNQFSKSLTV